MCFLQSGQECPQRGTVKKVAVARVDINRSWFGRGRGRRGWEQLRAENVLNVPLMRTTRAMRMLLLLWLFLLLLLLLLLRAVSGDWALLEAQRELLCP